MHISKRLVLKQLGHTYLIATSKYHSTNHKSEKYAFGFEIILDHLKPIKNELITMSQKTPIIPLLRELFQDWNSVTGTCASITPASSSLASSTFVLLLPHVAL